MNLLKRFLRHNIISLPITISLSLLSLAVGWADSLVSLALTGLITGVTGRIVNDIWTAYCSSYQKRISSPRKTLWYVSVNQVFVGTLTDSEFAQLQLNAVKAPILYARQAKVILFSILNAIKQTIEATAFWGAVGIAVLTLATPQDVATLVIEEIRNASSAELLENIRAIVWFAAFVGGMTSLYLVSLGNGLPGYRNVFKEAVKNNARIFLDVPADGDITVQESLGFCKSGTATAKDITPEAQA